jgi:hypothetical protein
VRVGGLGTTGDPELAEQAVSPKLSIKISRERRNTQLSCCLGVEFSGVRVLASFAERGMGKRA